MSSSSTLPASTGTAPARRARLRAFASPQACHALAGRLLPGLRLAALVLLATGLFIGLALAPTDHQQGDAYRILFVHVPTAWVAMVLYLAMAFWGALGLVLNTRLSFMMMQALAPTGALAAFLCLWTGALWGRPTWGTWWVWDARLTSMLLLLFLYVGFIALQSAIEDPRRADRAGALVALVGALNVPVIYFSVQWWNTLHQGASITLRSAPALAAPMLAALLLCALGLWLHAADAALARLRCIVLQRERHSAWVARLPELST